MRLAPELCHIVYYFIFGLWRWGNTNTQGLRFEERSFQLKFEVEGISLQSENFKRL